MSLTFYFAPMSTASVTHAVLAELDIPFERVTLDIPARATSTPEFLAINPNGQVPAIVHDGTAIWESAAITLYLGEMFGVDAGLYPKPGAKRGEAMKWVVWANVKLAEAAGRLARALDPRTPGAVEPGTSDFVPVEHRPAGAAEKAREDLAALLAILNGGLDGRPFLLGDYTLVDTHLQAFVGWLGMMGIDLAPHPNVAAWLRRCMARPALAAQQT